MQSSSAVRRFALVFLVAGAGALIAVACGGEDSMGPPGNGDPSVASVEVSPGSATLTAIGEQASFEATALDSAGSEVSGASISWSSDDQSVATVDGTGTVTAAGNGNATITAESEGVSGTATVTVDQEVSSVATTPDTGSVTVGDTTRFSAEAVDANGNAVADAEVAWSSTDTDVATVDGTGLVTGESEGSAMIAAEAAGMADSSVVNVTPPIASVAVSPDSAGVAAFGATADYGAAALDADGDTLPGVAFAWSSSDTAVAAVDGSGVATARSNGSTTITASTAGVSGSALFTVDQEVSSVTVSPDSASITAGDTTRFEAEASDSNGNAVADAEVAWSSTDTDVATVDGTGLVTGESEGSAMIVAESSGQADSATVVVEAESAATISAVSGGGQQGVTTRTYQEPLVVEVTDGGEPVSGVTVSWTVTSGDASLSSQSTTTGSDGQASVEVSAGETTGTITVEAASQGQQGSPVTFDLETTTALFLVGDIYFEDPQGNRNTDAGVQITLGQDVIWEWVGNVEHNVRSGEGQGGGSGDGVPEGGGSLMSDTQSSGTYSFEPSVAGTWEFYCAIHPDQMYGTTIVVEEGSSSDASADARAAADLEPGDVVRPEGSHFIFVYRGPAGAEAEE